MTDGYEAALLNVRRRTRHRPLHAPTLINHPKKQWVGWPWADAILAAYNHSATRKEAFLVKLKEDDMLWGFRPARRPYEWSELSRAMAGMRPVIAVAFRENLLDKAICMIREYVVPRHCLSP